MRNSGHHQNQASSRADPASIPLRQGEWIAGSSPAMTVEQEASSHDLHRQANFSIPACRRTTSAIRTATTRARSRPCAPLRPRLDHRLDHRGLLRALDRAASRRQDFRHRLLVEDTDYFLGNSHGFNSVHGRMPSVLTGANLANRDLIYLAFRATVTRPRSASASSPIRSGAAST